MSDEDEKERNVIMSIEFNFAVPDPLRVIKALMEKLNELTEEKTTSPIFFVEGTVIGFNDGGKLDAQEDGDFGKRYERFDIKDFFIKSEDLTSEDLTFVVRNVVKFGLTSHGLFGQIDIETMPDERGFKIIY